MRHRLVLSCLAALSAFGCATGSPPRPSAVATLEPTRGNTAAGTIRLAQEAGAVVLRGRVTGLKPGQEHGFHVHEKGDCSSPDATSAGGHLNPDAKPHGPPQAAHHAGDLPSIKADANGNADVLVRVSGALFTSQPGDFAGKALVVHASADDYATQPSGNSGGRIACGVISSTPVGAAAGKPASAPKT